jgi:DNA-binding transcriptional MerR regulator
VQRSDQDDPLLRVYRLFPPAQRAGNGYRIYGSADVNRLRFIAGARSLGFSPDIVQGEAQRDRREAPCRYVLDRIRQEMAQIDRRIADLQRMQGELASLMDRAQGRPLDDVEGKDCVCHLV